MSNPSTSTSPLVGSAGKAVGHTWCDDGPRSMPDVADQRRKRGGLTRLSRRTAMLFVAIVSMFGALPLLARPASAGTVQCNGTYVRAVTQGASVISVDPTTYGRWAARYDTNGAWAEVRRCSLLAPFSPTVQDSLRTQFDCHALWSAGAFGRYTGGATWDLETWRVPTRNLWTWTYNKCNW